MVVVNSPTKMSGLRAYALLVDGDSIKVVPDVVQEVEYMTEEQREQLLGMVGDDPIHLTLSFGFAAFCSDNASVPLSELGNNVARALTEDDEVTSAPQVRGPMYVYDTVTGWDSMDVMREAFNIVKTLNAGKPMVKVALDSDGVRTHHFLPISEDGITNVNVIVDDADSDRIGRLKTTGFPRMTGRTTYVATGNVVGQVFT
jgi:hypothetical protein